MEIEVVFFSVNISDIEFSVVNGKIYFGLFVVKGCGGLVVVIVKV